jgi:ferredoxin
MDSLERFQPLTEENGEIRATRFLGLCKSCGECVMKCPVDAISWDDKHLGVLGERAILIDLDKCIGCGVCERTCPDSAIKITNKRLASPMWQRGFLGWMVRHDLRAIELAVTTLAAKPERLEKVGRTKHKTRTARLVRLILRYRNSRVRKSYDD